MMDVAALTRQVGRIGDLDPSLLQRASREGVSVPDEWGLEYGEYQSGGWLTLSLYNESGDPNDLTIRDCEPQETTLLKRMPATRELLRSFGLSYMWVRIARLSSNSFLWEHRDYEELSDVERHRLHIPLRTNRSSALVTGGAKVHLGHGGIWRLVPTHAHGACNLTGPDRVHLIMDCYADDAFRRFTENIHLTRQDVQVLPEPEDDVLEGHLDRAVQLLTLGYGRVAEQSLLRLFYSYAMPEGTVYDLILEAYRRFGDESQVAAWQDTKKVMLGLD
ncbi:aspartyl/asparaginyl beta-hydroxylase domain-containing protein [Saccharopolyspora sp. NPDC047091]|uniref:aspartyl/asparaginyl beta-hydroxylase domain-containing protein n=1 Tax=Saccharopolyspora sp. NPDC047091 TaxID=3155924 RepID=UPI0033E759EE